MKGKRTIHYNYPSFIIVAGLAITAVSVSGCATGTISTGKISNSEDVFINAAYTYEDGDELVICGRVKRGYRNCCDSARGHIDIALLTPDGFVIDAFSTLYYPHNIPKVRSRSSRFEVRRPYLPPDGLIIRMAYHSDLEAADSTAYAGGVFNCEQNMAIPQYDNGQYRDIVTKTEGAAAKKLKASYSRSMD